MKFKLSKKLTEKYPTAVEYIVVAQGLNNEIAGKWILDRTKEVIEKIQDEGDSILNDPKYSKWLEVYEDQAKTIGLKGKDFLPSHVALAKRVLAGKDVPNINPVVNFYNLYSLEHGIPIGGEDLSVVYGDMELGLTEGGELFAGIGSDSIDVLEAGEVVWRDAHSVTCRVWAWCQAERTKLSKGTKDIYFIFDSFRDISSVEMEEIIKGFADELEEKFGAQIEVGVLNADNPEFEVNYETKNVGGMDIKGDLKKFLKKEQAKSSTKRAFMKRKPTSMNLRDDDLLLSRLSLQVDSCLKSTEYEGASQLVSSINPQFGDVSSTLALRLSKELKQPARIIADNIVRKLKVDVRIKGVFSEITLMDNGFINFGLSGSTLMSELINALSQSDDFGGSNVGENRIILIESPAINPNKPAHVGHLLNLFIGRSLGRLFEKVGFKSDADNLINDRGIPICQAMWAWKKFGKDGTPKSEKLKHDHYVGKYYFHGKKAYDSDEKAKEEINRMLRDWELGDSEVLKLWKQLIDWAFEGQMETFERLHEERGHLWLESELYKGGKDVIMKYLGKGVVEELPDGAIVGRIEEEYGVPDVVLIKSDGTSLYHTQDVYLTLQKIKKFQPWKAIWIIGEEQITHLQRLFALIDALGILPVENLYHYAYAMVVDKDGKIIKSRDGVELTADGMLDMMHEAALKVIESRKIKVDLKNKDAVAESVGTGALRYAFLSRDPFKNITFDVDEAVSFTGRSGPYIMYSYARAKSVLRKALGEKIKNYKILKNFDVAPSKVEISNEERRLLLKLLFYPNVILTAANNYAPNVLAEFLYEVASAFNNFYEHVPISQAKGDQREFRLALTKLMTNVLRDGLEILGIDVLERM